MVNTNRVGFLPSTPFTTIKTEMVKVNLAKKHRRLQYLHASSWQAELLLSQRLLFLSQASTKDQETEC